MIFEASWEGSMPELLLHQVIEKADGVPLYIEELTNSMLSTPSQARGTARTAPPALLRVPDTLSDALMGRLHPCRAQSQTLQSPRR